LSGGSPRSVHRTDVLIHALNALLLWRVLGLLLARRGPQVSRSLLILLAWALSLLWALHPMLTRAYAADMGRTHLLCATFVLLSLMMHIRAMEPGRGTLFVWALLLLIAAMLCKAAVGWVLVVLVLEWSLIGWRAALQSPRIYLVGLICAIFAALTYWTTQRAGLVEDASVGLFGDPIARSAMAVWLYARNLFMPLWLCFWYPPDPRTGWTSPLVWLGVLPALGSIVHAVRSLRSPRQRAAAVGWAWCWGLLLPVIGIIGARESAADDRYFYQPLMGLALVLGSLLVNPLAGLWTRNPRAARRAILAAAIPLAAIELLWSVPHTFMYRSPLLRAERLVALSPGDPRGLEALAAEFNFATTHPLPPDDLARVPPGQTRYGFFLDRYVEALRAAAGTDNLARYFPTAADRAGFHRRLSHGFRLARQYQESLEQAQRAQELEPEAYLTWRRLAHAYQGLQRWDEALQAYQRCEERLPADLQTRAAHYTDFGYLLLFDLDRAEEAYPRFQAALATGHAPTVARVGLARCEIRVGEGSVGYDIVMKVLNENPQDALAGLVLAEYHLRSHHWQDAAGVYETLLAAYQRVYYQFDWYYEALRGFESVCAQTGRWRDALLAWDAALQLHPDRREFKSFRVWAAAGAGVCDEARRLADLLLAEDTDNPMACLAYMLCELRASRVAEAAAWARRAGQGQPVSKARSFERAVAALNMLTAQEGLPPGTQVVIGAVYMADRRPEAARSVLTGYLATQGSDRWSDLAASLLGELGVPATVPATQGAGD